MPLARICGARAVTDDDGGDDRYIGFSQPNKNTREQKTALGLKVRERKLQMTQSSPKDQPFRAHGPAPEHSSGEDFSGL